jgi:Dolichyl-phosphate-mannose-protein mannosyltransferase
MKKEKPIILIVLAALAILTYLPTLTQPFISDDYPNIRLALEYGPVSGWEKMADDAVQRVRATSFILMYGIYRIFGLEPAAYYIANIIIHIINCWLVYASGRWRAIGYRVSFWAAAFFAVYEGHAEAIMWFSACNELLLFFFGFLAFLAWLIFLEKETSRFKWLGLSFAFFILALLSKESSVIFIPLFALPLLFPQRRLKESLYLLPFVVLGGLYAISIFMTNSHSFRFQDKSFVLTAPFWITWTKSYGAMLWFWGLSAIIALSLWKNRRQPFMLSLVWIGISFIPYMFVDYMHRIPSRQTYLASTGLAWLMGAAIVHLRDLHGENKKLIVKTVLAIILIHNVTYLWTKKRQQFLLRAQPTEQLLSFAQNVNGRIFVKCFPLHRIYGESALELILKKPGSTLIWMDDKASGDPPVASFCYRP